MKAHELTRPDNKVKKFCLKNGRVVWTKAHMNGDRRRVCISRTEAGREIKQYIRPHTEVIPENEVWFHRNKQAKKLVNTGLKQASVGDFSESPA